MIGNIIQPPDLTNSHTVTVPSKKCATLPYRSAIKSRRPDDREVALMLAPINGQPPADRARNAAVDASSTAV
ncbi:hypothetical protein RS3R1_44780 [Pseudomonas atacamensis]|uniref:Uncharacterized protein n=1 Tax=Pseudomonas atacamensis TaxID=2565368 RepID=A0ABQ5PPG9_9PSED|nr:hypothetical protein RS3R1_44780 [Pseudomonas atacamensis]